MRPVEVLNVVVEVVREECVAAETDHRGLVRVGIVLAVTTYVATTVIVVAALIVAVVIVATIIPAPAAVAVAAVVVIVVLVPTGTASTIIVISVLIDHVGPLLLVHKLVGLESLLTIQAAAIE
jgi:hypothetical protein